MKVNFAKSSVDSKWVQGIMNEKEEGWRLLVVRKQTWRYGKKKSLSLEETFKISKFNHHLTLPSPPLYQGCKYHIHTALKHLHRLRLHHFHGQPVPMHRHFFWEEISPDIWPHLSSVFHLQLSSIIFATTKKMYFFKQLGLTLWICMIKMPI